MRKIQLLNHEELSRYQDAIIRHIYESNRMAAYMESYQMEDAVKKYQELLTYSDGKKAVIYGCIIDKELSGFLWAYEYPFRDDDSRLYVSILHVDQKERGKGIGSLLIEQVEMYASGRGYTSIFLHTEAFNENAIQFYRANGYEVERIQLVKQFSSKKNLKIDSQNNKEEEILRIDVKKAEYYQESLTRLFVINTKSHILTSGFDDMWAKKKILELIDFLKEEKAIVYGYYVEKELAGFIWIFPHSYRGEKRYLLNAVSVFPQYRDRQIARKLFYKAESSICNQGESLYTHVDAINQNAYQLYIHCGMKAEEYQMVKKIKKKVVN